MTRMVRGRWTTLLLVAAAGVLPAACRRSGAEDGAASAATITKASTPAGGDSLRDSAGIVAAGRTNVGGQHTVLFIGTSLTAGLGLSPDSAYPQLVQQKIESDHLPYEVVNAGVSGETTAGLLRRMDWLMRGKFDVVVLESGANDGLRGIPVATVMENLRNVLWQIRTSHPQAKVVVVQMEAPPNLGPAYTNAFHAIYPDVAHEAGATLMPFLLQGVAGDRALNQADGIHPNQRGEHIVAENVWKTLEPLLKQPPTGL